MKSDLFIILGYIPTNMRSLKVSGLVKEASAIGLVVTIPKIPTSTTSFMDRVWSICDYHQRDDIVKKIGVLPSVAELPLEKQEEELNKYIAQFNQELKRGLGRQNLIKRIPEYVSPENIPELVKEVYAQDGAEGGVIAQRLLAYNPDLSVPLRWNFPEEEETRSIQIPNTDILIKYRMDLDDFMMGLYEFKLTTKKNLSFRLSEAVLQLYLYDFVQRLKFNIRCYQGMFIDIACIDEEIIYSYNLFSKPVKIPSIPGDPETIIFNSMDLHECRNYYEHSVKETLLALFSRLCGDQIQAIEHALNTAYEVINPRMDDDEAESILRHRAEF